VRGAWVLAGVAAVLVGGGLLLRAPAPPPAPPPPAPPGPPSETPEQVRLHAKDERIREHCSKCHFFPPPSTLPRAEWGKKVLKMYDLANQTLLESRQRPLRDMKPEEVIEYMEAFAPAEHDCPPFAGPEGRPGLRFEEHARRASDPKVAPPGVGGIFLEDLFEDLPGNEVVVCDMLSGLVTWGRPAEADAPLETLARLRHPVRARVADLDGDGRRDLLVSDLGSAPPTDAPCGTVEWLRRTGPRTFETITILKGVGRVADARAADLDGDGDLDVVVSAYGWYTTGRTVILWNRGKGADGLPSFGEATLDERQGSITCPVVDLDGDGRLDVIVLIAQENEAIAAYMNRGGGRFMEEKVFAAPHPHHGTSAMDVADLDGDGDLDVVMVNGDTLDDFLQFKPWQGVTWYENRGTFPFEPRWLGVYYGAQAVSVADLDGDGDPDIVASSMLPRCDPEDQRGKRLPAVAWWEQTSKGVFRPWTLLAGTCENPALATGDIDGDGRMDVLVGTMRLEDRKAEPSPLLLRVLFGRK
jgi:hypothetical protein